MSDGPVAQIIRQKLEAALSPQRLEIEDDSWRHAGHHHDGGMDAKAGGESHFNLTIVSAAFEGQSLVNRHRMIKKVLADELSGPIHALSIKAKTPDEFGNVE